MSVIGEAFVAISPETSGFASKLESQFSALNLGGIGALAGAAIGGAAIIGLLKIGETFANVRHQIEQETGATGKALSGLGDTVNSVFEKVPGSLHNAATAVDELYQRGIPLGPQLTEIATQEAFLAKMTGGDLATQVDTTTAIFNKYGVALSDKPKLLDAIFKASQQSGTSFATISSAVLAGGAAFQQFGLDAFQVTALIGQVSKAVGSDGLGKILASFRVAFANITSKGLGDPAKVFADLNKEFHDGTPLAKAQADAFALLGKRGGTELIGLMQAGKLNFDAFLKDITDGKGGIVATGEATLSLGDQIALIWHNALVNIEPVATALTDGVSKAIAGAAGPVSALGSAFGALLISLAPVGEVVGVVLVGAFEALGPIATTFASGVQLIADVLGALPGPVLAATVALAALVSVTAGYGSVALAWDAACALVAAGAEAVLGPVGLAIIAVTAIGAAFRAFNASGDAVKKEASDIGKALFDASGSGQLFATGVTSAAQGLTDYLNAQIAAGKDQTLAVTLTKTGHSVADLAPLFSGTQAKYDAFVKSVSTSNAVVAKTSDSWIDKLKTIGKLLSGEGDTKASVQQAAQLDISKAIVDSLNKEQAAYITSAQKQLVSVAATGALTTKQISAIEVQTRNTDGTINYSKVLDTVNKTLEAASAAQDKAASSAAAASPAYASLVTQFAQGKLSADDLQTSLAAGFNFDTAGAKAAVTSLTSQIKGLTSEVQSAFPALTDASKNLSKGFQNTYTDLIARTTAFRLKYGTELLAAARSGQTLSGQAHTDFTSIANDLASLAKNTDLDKFTNNLQQQATQITVFFAAITKIAKEGFPDLASNLLSLGVQGGAALASGFAADSNKAAAANGAALVINTAKNATLAQVLALTPDFIDAGKSITAGAVKGMKDGLQPGDAVQQQAPAVIAAMKYLATLGTNAKPDIKTPVTQAVASAAGAAIADRSVPSAFQGLGDRGGAAFKPDLTPAAKDAAAKAASLIAGDATVPSASKTIAKKTGDAFAPDIKGAAAKEFAAAAALIPGLQNLPNVAGLLGVQAGEAFGQGLANGISEKSPVIASAASAAANAAVTAVRNTHLTSSPSRVAIGLGQSFSEGLALGVLSGQSDVNAAGAQVASTLTGTTQSVIQGFNDAASVSSSLKELQQVLGDLGGVAGATTGALSTAQQSLQDFLSNVIGALPTASTAITNFLSAQNSAQSTVTSSLDAYHKAYKNYHDDTAKQRADTAAVAASYGPYLAAQNALNAALAKKLPAPQIQTYRDAYAAAKSTFDRATSSLHSANTSIANDQQSIADASKTLTQSQQALATASDPKTFIANLEKQTSGAKKFTADIAKLNAEGFTDLAKQLAAQGPAAAGALADSFAKSTKDSKLANNAIKQSEAYATTFTDTMTKLFGSSTVTDAATAAGSSVGSSIGAGAGAGVTVTFTNAIQTVTDNLKRNPIVAHATADTSQVQKALDDVHAKMTVVPDVTGLAESVGTALTNANESIDVTPHLLPLAKLPDAELTVHPILAAIDKLTADISPHLLPIPKPDPIEVDVIPHLVGSAPNATAAAAAAPAATQAGSQAGSGVQTLELDLTLVLEDGRVVTAKKTIPLPATTDLNQKVTTEIQAS